MYNIIPSKEKLYSHKLTIGQYEEFASTFNPLFIAS